MPSSRRTYPLLCRGLILPIPCKRSELLRQAPYGTDINSLSIFRFSFEKGPVALFVLADHTSQGILGLIIRTEARNRRVTRVRGLLFGLHDSHTAGHAGDNTIARSCHRFLGEIDIAHIEFPVDSPGLLLPHHSRPSPTNTRKNHAFFRGC